MGTATTHTTDTIITMGLTLPTDTLMITTDTDPRLDQKLALAGGIQTEVLPLELKEQLVE